MSFWLPLPFFSHTQVPTPGPQAAEPHLFWGSWQQRKGKLFSGAAVPKLALEDARRERVWGLGNAGWWQLGAAWRGEAHTGGKQEVAHPQGAVAHADDEVVLEKGAGGSCCGGPGAPQGAGGLRRELEGAGCRTGIASLEPGSLGAPM